MAKEPEPQSTGQSNNPSFSVEDELNAFRKILDGPTKVTLPGFLFRGGWDREYKLGSEFEKDEFKRWAGLLERHGETYQRALEARDQLWHRVDPVGILGKIQEAWGVMGKIQERKPGALLTYSYVTVRAERKGGGNWIPRRNLDVLGNTSGGGYISSGVLTGKWFAASTEVQTKAGVFFGNDKFYDNGNYGDTLNFEELNEFFADYYQHNSGGFPDLLPLKLPETIWRRPDNLVVLVIIPFKSLSPGTLLQEKGEGRVRYYGNEAYCFFDPTVSQQDIFDRLLQQMEAQRKIGQLPSQLEALELAKIEELRKRGLFLEATPST